MTIVAVNRFDKEKSETLSVEAKYTPEAASPPGGDTPETSQKETFRIDVAVHAGPTKITLEADGSVVYSGILKVGDTQAVDAKETIKIISENEAQTFVRLNGGKDEQLGSKAIAGKGVVYTSAGRQE
jgi:heme-binding NEAT domain protein